MKVDIAISEAGRKAVADSLAQALADTFTLYLKTHNFHWNVSGPSFPQLHKMFEEQYNELWGAVDEYAERIRALGFHAPGSFAEYGKRTGIKEASGSPTNMDMVRQLAHDHEHVIGVLREGVKVAQQHGDEESADLLIGRLAAHGKTAWMLRVQID